MCGSFLAASMCRSASSLPMFRLPECSMSQTRPASWPSCSTQSSMKWFPPPSVPICCRALCSRFWTPACSCGNLAQNAVQPPVPCSGLTGRL